MTESRIDRDLEGMKRDLFYTDWQVGDKPEESVLTAEEAGKASSEGGVAAKDARSEPSGCKKFLGI